MIDTSVVSDKRTHVLHLHVALVRVPSAVLRHCAVFPSSRGTNRSHCVVSGVVSVVLRVDGLRLIAALQSDSFVLKRRLDLHFTGDYIL